MNWCCSVVNLISGHILGGGTAPSLTKLEQPQRCELSPVVLPDGVLVGGVATGRGVSRWSAGRCASEVKLINHLGHFSVLFGGVRVSGPIHS